MSTFLWNCRGLGNAATVQELRDFAREFAPSILCVVETQIHKSRVESLAGTLGYDNAFAVSSTGRSGGLGIFWNNDIKVDCLPYSQYHIDAVVHTPLEEPWRLTCVYGEACVSERHKTWDMLKFIKAYSPLPWLCIGDFNEVLHREEHVGVNDRSNTQIQAFRETVGVCELMDLGYIGTPWTFEKKVVGGSYCRVRLDRALATTSWSERFPLATLHHLTAAASDHSPIILHHVPPADRPLQRHIFRYEAMW
jgi:exonuclease III